MIKIISQTLLILLLGLGQGLFSPALAQKKRNKNSSENAASVLENKRSLDDAEYYFIEGVKQYLLGRFPRAIDEFEKALGHDPDNPAIFYKIAESYAALEEYQEAEHFAQKALVKDKENKYYYLLLSHIYEKQEKYGQSIKTLNLLITEVPNTQIYYLRLGQSYQKMQNYTDALESYNTFEKTMGINDSLIRIKQELYLLTNQGDQAIAEGKKLMASDPRNPEYTLMQAELLIRLNKPGQAEPLLQALLEQYGSNARAHLLLARIYYDNSQWTDAFKQMEKGFSNPELNPQAKSSLLLTYLQGPQAEEQRQEFIKIAQLLVKTHPNHAPAFVLLGDLMLLEQNQEAALGYYAQAIRSGSSLNTETWKQILSLDASLNKMDSLRKHSEMALEYFPNQALFWYYNGMAHLYFKNYDQAVLAGEEGERLAFQDPALQVDFHVMLGEAFQGLEQYSESERSFKKALDKQPENAQVLNNYSYYLALRKEQLPLAKEMAGKLLKQAPNNPNYLDTYAWVLFQSKEYKNARNYLEKAVANSQDGGIFEHYGDVLFKLGEVEKALEQWQKAKQLGGSSPLIDKKIKNRNLYE